MEATMKNMSNDELLALIEKAREIIRSREQSGTARVEFEGYNARRFSRPWIAIVTEWTVGGRPELEFGSFVGSANDGGYCEIAAKEGDIIRWGRKDTRGNYSINKWGVFRSGEVVEIDQGEARDLFGKK